MRIRFLTSVSSEKVLFDASVHTCITGSGFHEHTFFTTLTVIGCVVRLFQTLQLDQPFTAILFIAITECKLCPSP